MHEQSLPLWSHGLDASEHGRVLERLTQNLIDANKYIGNLLTYKTLSGQHYTRYALDVMRCLRPKEVVNGNMVRKGRDYDGGYIMLDEIQASSIAYSLGINDDVSWDLEMAESGVDVFQYDHTIAVPPMPHPNFHFFKNGIAAESSPDGVFKSLRNLLDDNGHSNRNDIILKMDIEGAEWDVFSKMDSDVMPHFSQLMVEMHRMVNADLPGHTERVVAALQKLNQTHQVVHIHANNWGSTGLIGGVFMQDTLEVSYVRKSDHQFKTCEKIFPTELDMPCNPNTSDIYLGRLGVG